MDRHTPPNYLAWFCLIAAAVACGNLISNFVTAEVVKFEAELAAARLADAARSAREQRVKVDEAISAAQDRQIIQEMKNRQSDDARIRAAREHDAIGSKLLANCNDWRAADIDLSTPTTKAEMERNCAIYDRYVQTGVAPRR